MRKSESITKLLGSLSKCEFPSMPREGINPYYNSTYVKLDTIIEVTTPILRKQGLQIVQFPTTNERQVGLVSGLYHVESGEFMEDDVFIDIPVQTNKSGEEMNSVQEVGKTITYLRRYAISAMLNLATEEDTDGNTPAQQKGQRKQSKAPEKKAPAKGTAKKRKPAPKQKQEEPVAEAPAGRPFQWGPLLTSISNSIEKKAVALEKKPITEKNIERYRKVLGKHLTHIWTTVLKMDDEARYEYFDALVGYGSTKEMPVPVLMVLLHWLDVDDFEDDISGTSLVEIKQTIGDASAFFNAKENK